tara:strand:+ start:459 stop:797 length:339 start_codon:yes stop_codon:yes gene_type:complete
MNPNNLSNYEIHELIPAYKRRQRDTGWGYAFAHAIPFAGWFVMATYASSRKTITPVLFNFAGFLLFWCLGGVQAFSFALIVCNPLTPITCKIGIEKARRYAQKRLKDKGDNS